MQAPPAMDPVLGHYLALIAAPSVAFELNVVVRGATSGTLGRVVRIISTSEVILESIPNALGAPTFAFSQNNAGPLTGETVNLDNGGTGTVSVFANSQHLPGFSQFIAQLHDAKYGALLPADGASDTPWWDANAKAAQEITITGASLAGTPPYFRKGDRCTTASGACTVQLVTSSGPDLLLKIVRKTGTISATQTLTNTTLGGPTTGTIGAVGTDPPQGIFVPYCALPNLRGLGTFYERTPHGNATDGGEPSLGFEARLLHGIAAHHAVAPTPNDRGWRFVPYCSLDGGVTDGQLGGVSVQVVTCTGTFPTSGTLVVGQTVTGPGGWSATVHGWNNTAKYLFVRATNGAVLGAGTLTLSGGATVTGDGAAHGWQKGSTHWNAWAAQITAATTAPASIGSAGALFAGSPVRWEGLVWATWEAEVQVHAPSIAAPFPTQAEANAAWVQLIADVRTFLGREDLPVAIWSHLPQSHLSDVFLVPGVSYAFFVRELILGLPLQIAGVTVVDSQTLGCEMADGTDNLYLRNADYFDTLSDAFWRHLKFGQVTVLPASGGYQPLPVGIHLGQSQATGFTTGATAVAFDRDPDLWPHTNFSAGLSTVDANLLSFNQLTNELQPFAVDINANGSWGTLPGSWGPETPVAQRMKRRFSDTNTASAKFAVFKFTVPGSCANAAVHDAAATWDPALSARPTIVPTCTVTAIAASGSLPARGRFTATAGTFSTSTWQTQQSCTVRGSALGNLAAGGNNSPPYTVQQVYAIAPDGSWLEIQGAFVAEGPRAFTLSAGPPPIWPTLTTQWARFVSICRDYGYVPAPRYLVWEQSESDLGRVAEYTAALTRLFEAFDGLFGLRLKGDQPLAKCLVLLHSQTPWPVPDADVTAMRAAQVAFAASIPNCVTVDPSDLSLELNQAGTVVRTSRLDNGIHHTGRAMVTKGFRIDAALATLGAAKGIPAHPAGELAVDFGAINGGTDDSSADGGTDGGTDAPADGPADEITAAESESIVDALDSTILDGGGLQSFTVNGQTTTFNDLDKLLRARKYYEGLANRANGLRRTRVGFRR